MTSKKKKKTSNKKQSNAKKTSQKISKGIAQIASEIKRSSSSNKKTKGNAQRVSEIKKSSSSNKKAKNKKKKTSIVSDVSTYLLYLDGIVFPVAPQKIEFTNENRNETVDLISGKQVNRPRLPGLTEISIPELMLPMVTKYHFANYQKAFKRPDYYLKKLNEWKQSKKKIDFVYARQINGVGLYDNGHGDSFKVTVEEVKVSEDADNGLDVYVDLKLKKWESWGSKELVITRKKSGKKTSKVKKRRSNNRKASKTYKVKKGDSLRLIAKKKLGSSAKWKSIYKLNKKEIDENAKKHNKPANGLYIFAGTVLKMPKG